MLQDTLFHQTHGPKRASVMLAVVLFVANTSFGVNID
jgi:hypothetical protein